MAVAILGTAEGQEILLDWCATARRPFPWREPTTSPWGVLVSEVMSQQTPMARVEPQWREWMSRWPEPQSLAQVSPAEVVRTWGKLGYPRRALRLHECAQLLARDYHNTVPSQVETLLTLPGVGSYTAHAVACFAFHHNVPVVDTNVRRVVARVHHGHPDQGRPRDRADRAEVAALLPADPEQGCRFSAALMEFGALVCTSRSPQCDECPLECGCAWVEAGRPAWDEEQHGKRPPVQKFVGTDRQVRGLLLDVVREQHGGVPQAALDAVWPDDEQRQRALESLLHDGLLVVVPGGCYSLPGETVITPTAVR